MDDLPTWFWILGAGLLGLLFGSFANVAIYRWPIGRSIATPRGSHCPHCDHAISGRDNIPVLSWLLLRRRCRHCKGPISARYPLIEVLTGGLFAGLAAVYEPSWMLVSFLVVAWGLVVASVIDIEHMIIPNKLNAFLAPVTLALLTVATVVDGEWADWRRAVVAGLLVPAGLLAMSEAFRLLRGKAGIGMGDIKLAPTLGMVLGYLSGWAIVIGLYATTIAAVVVAFTLIALGRANLATRIPFGPYLALGTLVTMLALDSLTGVWERLMGFA